MAQSKHIKATINKAKNSEAARRAVKKKQLSSNKSRNDILREQLDRDAASILTICGLAESQSSAQLQPTAKVDISQSLTDVTAILRGL